jgi:uncharacterized protein (UPF0548 family)
LFLPGEPSAERIEEFLNGQKETPFSYPEVGASREVASSVGGYTVDHNRVWLGESEEVFVRAVEALRSWKMFELGWVRIYPLDAPIEVGTTVAVIGRHYGFWSLNACRIVYLVDEVGEVNRYGFAYGTLPEHAESGEERFTVEWNRADSSVWYDVYAFSRPRHPLARLGYPVGRALQKRFARDSKQAMARAVEPE